VRRLGLLVAVAGTAHAQFISAGVKAGSPLNDPAGYLSPLSTHAQGRWTGGPTVEFHLPFRLSFETDALYRGDQGSGTFPVALGPTTTPYLLFSSQKTKAWDFPILLKYRLLGGPVRPFLSAGYAWSHQSSNSLVFYNCPGPPGSCSLPDAVFVPHGGSFDSTILRRGPVAAAGIDFGSHHVTISPEVRFTHLMHPNTNQVTAMVGFTFKR